MSSFREALALASVALSVAGAVATTPKWMLNDSGDIPIGVWWLVIASVGFLYTSNKLINYAGYGLEKQAEFDEELYGNNNINIAKYTETKKAEQQNTKTIYGAELSKHFEPRIVKTITEYV